ncbi:MAG: ATP-dependent Clp protease proteolytic subunit [Puniceicoccales bacterium]|nr:ATP-dependent Clp protease proteolytic subunit [Puniceicoccales bacterium]
MSRHTLTICTILLSVALSPIALSAGENETTSPVKGPNAQELCDKGTRVKKHAKETEKTDAGTTKDATKPAPTAPQKPPAAEDSPEIKAIQKEIARLTLEKNLIDAKLAHAEAKRREADAARNQTRVEERARIESRLAFEAVKEGEQNAKKLARLRALETEAKLLKLQTENALGKYSAEAALFQKRQELGKIAAAAKPLRLKEPLVNGTLCISDRRITFNGVVTSNLAEHIVERVNFFNNQDTEYPIFIVIDNSPGGSVAAGFQILKAMESSKAPVFVVVKGFAASMAAVITTLAQRSFCYDNTIILHHQMSTFFGGNMRTLEDRLKFAQKWYDRLATPVARKMGSDLKTFTKQMYAHDAEADWQEFGTQAQKLKWVDHIVERIVETAIVDVRQPAAQGPQRASTQRLNGCEAKVDEKGMPYVQLPPLENPFDLWWIYDKHGYYRAQH